MGAEAMRMRGFSLIELMVAMALGVVLMLGVVNIFSSVRASTQLEQNISRMQENGRFLMNFMLKQLHDAGYRGLPGQELNISAVASPATGATAEGGGTAADSVQVNYVSNYNCSGLQQAVFALKTVVFSWSADVDPTGNTSPGVLWSCTYDGVAEVNNQPLADGIQTLQVLYGEDTDDDGAPNQYLDANNVGDWSRVVSLEVGVLVQSPDTGLALGAGDTVQLLGQDFEPDANGRLLKPFATTVALRNVINM